MRDLRVAEATCFEMTVRDGEVTHCRVGLDLSFKLESGD
jgi:flavin-binding protein dodecin